MRIKRIGCRKIIVRKTGGKIIKQKQKEEGVGRSKYIKKKKKEKTGGKPCPC